MESGIILTVVMLDQLAAPISFIVTDWMMEPYVYIVEVVDCCRLMEDTDVQSQTTRELW